MKRTAVSLLSAAVVVAVPAGAALAVQGAQAATVVTVASGGPTSAPTSPVPLYTDKHQENDGANLPAPPRPTPDEEASAWVKAHEWTAPPTVATGLVGTTPPADVWWTWNGPVKCPVMPVDGVCKQSTVTTQKARTAPLHRFTKKAPVHRVARHR